MGLKAFDVGDAVRMSAIFKVDNVPTDPSTVRILIRDPAGVQSSYSFGTDAELEQDATGTFHVDIDVDSEGIWIFRWEGTGVAKAAFEGEFKVRESAFY